MLSLKMGCTAKNGGNSMFLGRNAHAFGTNCVKNIDKYRFSGLVYWF